MLSRLSFAAAVALVSLAVVSAAPPANVLGKDGLGNSLVSRQAACGGDQMPQCCEDVGEHDDPAILAKLKALGVDSNDVLTSGLVGARCSKLLSTDVCTSKGSQPVCCSGSGARGLVAMSCSPITVNLLQ